MGMERNVLTDEMRRAVEDLRPGRQGSPRQNGGG